MLNHDNRTRVLPSVIESRGITKEQKIADDKFFELQHWRKEKGRAAKVYNYKTNTTWFENLKRMGR